MDTRLRILILGGGTAGWMTANLFARQWDGQCDITLIESTDMGTVGVGEGSTPFLRDFFNRIGVAEQDWMPACDATFKCGIQFPGWTCHDSQQSYFHPFYSEIDSEQMPAFFAACQARSQGIAVDAHPDAFFVSHQLSKQGLAPYSSAGQLAGIDYGYHFDAAKLATFLRSLALSRGVRHIDDKVTDVIHSGHQMINALMTAMHGQLTADLFVDCSGFNARLMRKALQVDYLDYSDVLFNDSALAITTAHDSKGIQSCTLSSAVDCGWVWQIPLQSRMGNGLVYSSRFSDEQRARQTLASFIGTAPDAEMRKLSWTPGRLAQHWKGNCLAIGLAQGFLEPLEAPMLNLMQHSIEAFIDYFSRGLFSSRYQARFNQVVNQLIDGTRDYLQAHYLLNTRTDSEYWQAARDNPHRSAAVTDIIRSWQQGQVDAALRRQHQHLAYYRTSWYALLAGMHSFVPASQTADTGLMQQVSAAQSRAQQLAASAVSQYQYLSHPTWTSAA